MLKKELLASFLIVLLLAGGLLSTTPLALASSNESGNENSNEESNEDSSGDEGTDEPPSDETPPVDGIEEPIDAPAGPIEDFKQPLTPTEQEDSTVTCPDGTTEVIDMKDCPDIPETTELPPQCAPNTTALECLGDMIGEPDCGNMTPLECLEDKLNNPDEPIVEPPLDENQTDPSLPPETSPSPEVGVNVTLPGEPIEDTTCPPGQFPVVPGDPSTCVDCEGPCPEPIPPGDNQTDPIPDPGDNSTDPGDNQTDPIDPGDNTTIVIKKIFKNINIFKSNSNSHGHGNFPIDIIGLSVKDNGDAILCAFNINNDWIQCQDFEMEDNKVNQDFWRVIETNHNKDYDNGNTGSDDIDDAIDDIKSQDFSDLKDADNHDFGIDISWVAINPQGEGVTCLVKDQSGKGKSLCEPFKVSAQDVDGQITEGVEFD